MSVCFIKGFLFLKISQNGKTLCTRYFPEFLLALLKKFLKLFIFACFALLFFKSFQNFCYLLSWKVYKTFQKSLACFLYLALKVSKTFHKLLALKVYKTFHNFFLALKVSKTFHNLLFALKGLKLFIISCLL